MLHLEERLRMGDEIMKTYIYEGGFGIVAKSGVGSAIKHQKNMLKQADIEEAKSWKEADIVHINTVFPDSVLAACLANIQRWRTSGTLLSVPTVSHLFLRNGSVSATVLEILSLHRQSIPEVFWKAMESKRKSMLFPME